MIDDTKFIGAHGWIVGVDGRLDKKNYKVFYDFNIIDIYIYRLPEPFIKNITTKISYPNFLIPSL